MLQVRYFIIILWFSFLHSSQTIGQSEKLIIINQDKPATRELIKIDHLNYLHTAKLAGSRNNLTIQLPVGGTMMSFLAIPNEVIDEVFRKNYPDILTYDLVETKDGKINGALTLSTCGLFATILNTGKMVSVFPQDINKPEMHVIEYGIQADLPFPQQTCGHDHSQDDMIHEHDMTKGSGNRSGFTIGAKRYNYRVAIVTTGEFYQNNGNNDNAVRTVVVNTVNAISAIYTNELSFRLSVGSNIYLGYTDAATDAFIPDKTGGQGRLTQSGTIIPLHFPTSSFDIGHVFHRHASNDGWSSGGIAQIKSVCDNSTFFGPLNKASGWSGSYTNVGNGWINLASHEFGHQFGANHCFNGIGGTCTTAISTNYAYEIGSGTTIMAYNGICDQDQNIPDSGVADNYFHVKSLEQITDYVYNGEGGTCGGPVLASNPIPSVNANPCGALYRLPKGTPFYLKAQGLIADGDTHTYCWEEVDEDGSGISPTQGFIGAIAANDPRAPLFRSYPPATTPERYFPALPVLIGHGSDSFEALPNVPRSMNFSVTIRDNNPTGGAASTDNITVDVQNTGPFVISRPSGGEVIQAGQPETFTWSTNGSNNLCNKIRIKLSTDGGQTFPFILAENINYASGSLSFTFPSNFVKTNTARILMECSDFDCYKFFNVSSSDFTINSACIAENSVVCSTSKVSLDEGDPGLNLNMNKVIGNRIFSLSRQVSESLPKGNIAVKGVGGSGCSVVSTNYYYSKVSIYVTGNGNYTFSMDGDGFMSLFRSNFNPLVACNSFVTSTATDSGNNSIFRGSSMTVTLNQCTEYILAIYSYADLPVDLTVSLSSGPGLIIEKNSTPSALYQHVYVVVNNADDKVVMIGQSTDLRTLGSGNYSIYSVVLDKNATLGSFIGNTYSSMKMNTCMNEGYNSRLVEIKPACKITDIGLGEQSKCDAITNLYTQKLIINYEFAPPNGKLRVDGMDYDITGSPQTITLNNLTSNGQAVDVNAYFTALPNCKFTRTAFFTAPLDCCPAVVELGGEQNKCAGDQVILDAGNTGTAYVWYKDGLEIAGQNKQTLMVLTAGFYEVEVTHATGCKRRDSVTITFNAKPVVTLPAVAQFCEGETYTISPAISGGQTIKWYRNNAEIAGQTGLTLDINTAGKYKVVVTGVAGCMSEAESDISITPAPVVELGNDQNKCEGEEIILKAGSGGASYKWYRDGMLIIGANQSTYKPVQSGMYRVQVLNTSFCSAEDQVTVKFFASPLVEPLPLLINVCQGNIAGINAMASDYQTLQWFFNDNIIQGSNGLSLSASNSGMYSIEATNNIGCKTRKSTQVEVRTFPVIDITDQVSCIGSDVELFAGNDGNVYQWQKDGLGLSENMNTLTVNQNGLYSVTVTNTFGCSATGQSNVSFVTGPSLDIGRDTILCEGESLNIIANTNPTGSTIVWYLNGNIISGQNEFILNVTEAGKYEAAVRGGSPACTVKKSVSVSFNPKPTFSIGTDRTVCEGGPPIVLNAGQNTSFSWTFNGMPLATTQTITVDKSGSYAVTVKNSFNCSRKEQVKINIEALPTLELKSGLSLCPDKPAEINVESNGVKFEWKKSDVTIPGETGKSIKILTEGTYKCIATTAANCKKELVFTIMSKPSPFVELGKDTTLCPGEVLNLNAGIQKGYLWSDNSTSANLTVSAGSPVTGSTKKYYVRVANEFGCENADTINITLRPILKATLSADKPGVCNGQPVILTAGGGTKYKWADPSGTLSDTTGNLTVANPLVTTTYAVEVSDDCPGNNVIRTIEIKVFGQNNISAGKDTCVIRGRTIRLNARGGVKYEWDNKNLIVGAPDVPNPLVKPVEETVFSLTVTDTNGCVFTDEVKICVIDDPLASFMAISIITPNDDGKNDELYFNGLDAFPENTIKIFNRWGNMIFDAEGYQARGPLFNGYRNGERLPADTYYYILTFSDQVIKSSLTILWD